MPVIDDLARRWRRVFRRRRRDAVELGQQADEQIERLLIRRLERLTSVRRFVGLWLALFFLLLVCGIAQIRSLSIYYQSLVPVPGGLYSEGIVGSFTTANPLSATGTADTTVSHLVFSGLFKYDNNNQLTGDLAQGWTTNANQTQYTVHLRHNITWQDGKPFTADDVVFTYHTIQNPAAQSPLYSSWEGITVTEQDKYTVVFALPDALSSFPYNLTNGIAPEHLLANTTPEQLRSASFNTEPIGTGPFAWKSVEVTGTNAADNQQRIDLSAFNKYWSGRPKLNGFSVITYSDDTHMIDAFEAKQLDAMSDLQTLPPELTNDKSVQTYVTPLTSAVMAFFNNSQQFLSDVSLRKALVSAVNRDQLLSSFSYPTIPVTGPLLRGQLGYNPTISELPFNLTTANQLLDQDGWARNSAGQRVKNGQPLDLSLVTQDTPQYTQTAQFLQQAWAQLGVKATVSYYDSDDLQSEIIANHDYDVLLYGINIGVDPDVYAYWDSSQASVSSQGHLNLSEYKSGAVDAALEAARTRSDPTVRAVKYQSFLSNWVQDAPALALYQPNFLYVTRGPVFGFERSADNSAVSRLSNVDQWEIRQQSEDIN
jgi:peptide/nickel transport system substrate-binding protein